MQDAAQIRREALKEKLVDIAEITIRESGMDAIKARPLAAKADCAVGAIYNVFDDLQDIVMAVNARTFRHLSETMNAAVTDGDHADPADELIAMALVYFAFAKENPRTWRSLFDLRMSEEAGVPAWYAAELNQIFDLVGGPVSRIFPDLDERNANLMVRALFSSVHGIILLGLENRISGVPEEDVEDMISSLLKRLTRIK